MGAPPEFIGPLYTLLTELVDDAVSRLVNSSATASRSGRLTPQDAVCAFHTISYLRSLVTDLESRAKKALQ